MIEIKEIDSGHKNDINIPNEPFQMFGKVIPSYVDEHWSYKTVYFEPDKITEMCFPDENYDFEAMQDDIFVGAYDGEQCIGLAILKPGFFKYMYLYDFKVNGSYRGQHIGTRIIEKAKEIAVREGYRGIYAEGQDNNPGACLFYLHSGFYIGGLNTNVYKGTSQEGKADIIFYLDCSSELV